VTSAVPVLRTERLGKRFGALQAVSDVSLALPQGARHALIGPNGAGKTTFINLLTGVLAPSTGDVYLGEERITALRQHPRVKRGLTRTFQINTLFPGLTVLESVVLAILQREGLAAQWWRPVAEYREQVDEAMTLLATPRARARRSCPTAASAWSRSRWLSPRGRASSCSTSPPRASRPPRARRCSASSPRSPPR